MCRRSFETLELRRRGFRFVALADDNFYPVTLTDLALAERQRNVSRLEQLRALRAERFELIDRLAHLPSDMVFFTQITMEAAEDPAFLIAMRRANIKGGLVGIEAVTPEGLKDVFKAFNDVGEALVQPLRTFRDHGVHVLGSFIRAAERSAHPVMSAEEIRARTQAVWDQFYSLRRIWERSRCTPTLRARLAFVLISKLYRQMYANTGIATDSARVSRANRWARLIAKPCRRLFTARPLPAV